MVVVIGTIKLSRIVYDVMNERNIAFWKPVLEMKFMKDFEFIAGRKLLFFDFF